MDNSEQKKEASNNDIIISNASNNDINNINDINPLKRPAADNSPTSTSNSDEDDDQVHNNEIGNGSKMDHVDYQILKHMKNENSNFIKQGGDLLESTKAEMGEVMEENQRLKKHLDQIMSDYQVLQMKYYQVSQQQQDSNKKPKHTNHATPPPPPPRTMEDEDEAELVSLSLGRSSSLDSKSIINNKLNSIINTIKERGEGGASSSNNNNNNEEASERSLDLGLDYSRLATKCLDNPRQQPLIPRSSPDNSFEESREGEGGGGGGGGGGVGGKETWTPSTMTKNNNSTNSSTKSGDDEVVQQPPVKKARVSVRARCDTPTMNDGCQWRKYGQKIAKGNPCPRAYYRCTVAPLCPVRKQVQRCAEDMSILITTYEGAHNHPLPISATAMASTTSAAAYMLMSGSSTSSSNNHPSHNHITTTIPPSTRSSTDLHTSLNFNILDNSNPNPPFYSSTTTSFAPPLTHPTITLDLTSTTTSASPTTQFNNRVSSTTPSTFAPRYTSSNLNFHSLDSSNSPWPNTNNSLLNYSTQPYNNKSLITPTHYNQDHNNNLFNLHNLLPKSNLGSNNLPNNQQQQQQSLPDTIAQAAKVLTSDPNFQSVLTAALSSFISSNNNNNNNNNNNGNNGAGIANDNGGSGSGSEFAQKMIKWGSNRTTGGVQTISSSSTTTLNSTLQSTSNNKGKTSANGCGSSLLSMAPSSTTNSQHGGSLMFLSPPLPLSASKSTSTSPSDSRDHAI